MKFSKIYEPKINEYDKNGKLALNSIIGIIENMGAKHSASVGDNLIESALKGVSWVLVEWNIKINELPDYTKELYIDTFAVNKKAELITRREFIVKDASSMVYITACERLVLQDFNNKSLVKVTPEMMEKYHPESELQNEYDFTKIKEPCGYDTESPLKIRKTDIDFNNHIHNTYYLDYALDLMDDLQTVSEIRILYKQPLKLGDSAVVKYKKECGSHTVGIYNNDTLCTLVRIK